MHMPIAAGQGVAAAATGSTLPADCTSTLGTAGPSGGLNVACLQTGGAFVDGRNVQTSGPATATLQAVAGTSGSAELKAWVYRDSSGPIVIDGPDVTVTTGAPGQIGARSFSVTGPRRVSVDVTGNTVPGVTISVRDPAGATLAVLSTSGPTAYLDTVSLPAAGTYSVVADPMGKASGRLSLGLNGVPPDSTGTMLVDGPAVKVTVTAPGQNGVRTFSGSNGQRVVLAASANTVPGVTCSIIDPTGATLTIFFTSGPTGSSAAVTLSRTGTYRVFVDPAQKATGSVSVRIHT